MRKITWGISTLNLKNDFLPLNEWNFIYYSVYWLSRKNPNL